MSHNTTEVNNFFFSENTEEKSKMRWEEYNTKIDPTIYL